MDWYKRTKNEVRWFDIRGLGKSQEQKRDETYSKIISYLRISPFTYEQLCKISGIHRNTLRKRLDELVLEKIILKHKYLEKINPDIIEKEIYGPFYKNPFSYVCQLFKKDCYLLNHQDFKTNEYIEKFNDFLGSDIRKIKQLNEDYETFQKRWSDIIGKFYLTNKDNNARENNDKNLTLNDLSNKYRKELTCIAEKIDFNNKNKAMDNLYLSLIFIMKTSINSRKLEIAGIKEGKPLKLLPLDKSEKALQDLESCIKFFSRLGMSDNDILVRFSTECTFLNINKSEFNIFISMLDYEDILNYFYHKGYKLSENKKNN